MSEIIGALQLSLNQVQIITVADELAFDRLEPEWQILFEAAGNASSFLRWEWHREWWKEFGEVYAGSSGRLQILTFRSSGKLVGILPLYLQKGGFLPRQLRFVSTGEQSFEVTYPEYLDLLCLEAFKASCYRVGAEHIFQRMASEWDEFNLGILAPESDLNQLQAPRLPSLPQWRSETLHTTSIANIGSGFESYLNGLPSSARQLFRRLLKQRSQQGMIFNVAASADEALSYLDQLIEIHQRRWKAAHFDGAFSSDKFVKFHKSLIASLFDKRAVLLCKLSFQGESIAILYGFLTKGKFDFYQSGIDLSQNAIKSPGILAHLLCLERMASNGVHSYDMLSGQSAYKERFATCKRDLKEISFIRPTLRSFVAQTQKTSKRVSNKICKLLRKQNQVRDIP